MNQNETRPIRYRCVRCAACCRWSGSVRVQPDEVERISAFLQLPVEAFTAQYTRLMPNRIGLRLTEGESGECVFLRGTECLIQTVKPHQCIDFPNGWNFTGFDELCRAEKLIE